MFKPFGDGLRCSTNYCLLMDEMFESKSGPTLGRFKFGPPSNPCCASVWDRNLFGLANNFFAYTPDVSLLEGNDICAFLKNGVGNSSLEPVASAVKGERSWLWYNGAKRHRITMVMTESPLQFSLVLISEVSRVVSPSACLTVPCTLSCLYLSNFLAAVNSREAAGTEEGNLPTRAMLGISDWFLTGPMSAQSPDFTAKPGEVSPCNDWLFILDSSSFSSVVISSNSFRGDEK